MFFHRLLLPCFSSPRPELPIVISDDCQKGNEKVGRNFSSERETKPPNLDLIRFLAEYGDGLQEDMFAPVEMEFDRRMIDYYP
jgi:hypothetical protein